MKQRIRLKNRPKTFSGRLFLLSVCFLAAALTAVGVTCCVSYNNMIRESADTSNAYYLENYSTNMSKMMQKIAMYTNAFLSNEDTNRYVEEYIGYRQTDSYLSRVTAQNLNQDMSDLIYLNQGIKGVQIVMEDYQLTNGNVVFEFDSQAQKYEYLTDLADKQTQRVFYSGSRGSQQSPISLRRGDSFQLIGAGGSGTSDANGGGTVGATEKWFAVISIDLSSLSIGDDITILDQTGNVVWSGSNRLDRLAVEEIVAQIDTSASGSIADASGDRTLYYTVSADNEWIYVTASDGGVLVERAGIVRFAVLLLALLAAATCVISYIVSKRFYRPLAELSQDLKNIHDFEDAQSETGTAPARAEQPEAREQSRPARHFSGRLLLQWGFRRKALLYFLIVSLLPAFAFILAFQVYAQDRSLHFFETIVARNMDTVRSNLSMETKNVELVSRFIMTSPVTQAAFDGSVFDEEIVDGFSRIIVSENFLKGDVSSIELINDKLVKIYSTNQNDRMTTDTERQMLSEYIAAQQYEMWMYGVSGISEGYQIPYIRKSYKYEDETGAYVNGFVIVNANGDNITQILEGSQYMFWGDYYVVNDDGRLVYAARIAAGAPEGLDPSRGQPVADNLSAQVYRDGNSLYFCARFEKEPWTLVNVVPISEIYTMQNSLLPIQFVLFLIIALVIFYLSHYYMNRMLQPIYTVRQDIREIEIGNITQSMRQAADDDDLQQLTDDIYNLILNSNRLMEEVYSEQVKRTELESRKQEAELVSLQSQINPHFLYNTLTSIQMMAEINDDRETAKMISALGKYFRYCTKVDSRYATVRDEFDFVHNCITFLRISMREDFSFFVFAEDAAAELRIPRLSVQPIVENAIVHGLIGKNPGGLILLSAQVFDDMLQISVADNGIGIPEEALAKLNGQLQETFSASSDEDMDAPVDAVGGIGLLNISKRVKGLFGPEWGLQIFSIPGEGTEVVLTMPYNIESK